MSGIDDILEMILKEARGRPGKVVGINIHNVMMETNVKVLDVLDVLREEQRRKKEDENKG